MAPSSAFTPKSSLTEAPTNLKEAIDWVLRVTGRDGKKNDECICGLAAAVTDLLQSVELEYHGYEGESKGTDSGDSGANKGACEQQVKERLNGLFSLVQGLGGTAVVRTYIDQLAQVLSALVGWSRIEKCEKGECDGTSGNDKPHGQESCKYLDPVQENTPCTECKCMKWKVPDANKDEAHYLGRKCTKCSDSGGVQPPCKCGSGTGGSDTCTAETCECALAGKCCKCCCKEKNCMCSKKECRCIIEDTDDYLSAYRKRNTSWVDGGIRATWLNLEEVPCSGYPGNPSQRRHQCARILLGSVCLIWSGLTYMYWTGKYHGTSPRWNNHILDGSGLDDGTLSQWLQALGFPRDMLNNHGPQNRLDKVIWNGLSDKLLLGFAKPSGLGHGVSDNDGNTARNPIGMNYPGLVHTIHRDSFNEQAIVFKNDGSSTSDIDQHKCGALYKLYILSCAYFTGLQKKRSTQSNTPTTPKTIRDILYWLSALPYSPAYKDTLDYAKKRLTEVLKKPGDTDISDKTPTLAFHQTGRWHPITVDEFNLFAHFQAVTQYCPLVLIGIQGGIHSATKGTKEPAIHALYSNTECSFTYPTVPIQAYNQVVHYIRALFYQLYFLRKQCAVKVALGGKWRECRYGKDVVSKGVISWMCLGCSPMEHDRKWRVDKVKGELGKVVSKGKSEEEKAKALLVAIGEVVVQLGNAQEALERKAEKDVIEGVKTALVKAKEELGQMKNGTRGSDSGSGALKDLDDAVDGVLKTKLEELTKGGGSNNGGLLGEVVTKLGMDRDRGKNALSSAIHKVLEVLKELWKGLEQLINEQVNEKLDAHQKAMIEAIKDLLSLCNSPKCPGCKSHSKKCGRQGEKKTCPTCHQQYMDGFPSPLQAFLEDRLPGFSCTVTKELLDKQEADKAQKRGKDAPPSSALEYPSAASHLGHCNGSGQCCPLPMGFRGQFHQGITQTGKRLYGILYFFSNENMMQSCVYTLVRVTAALSATTPQVLGDVFGFFRGGVGNKEEGKNKNEQDKPCDHKSDSSQKTDDQYFCGWCASGLREEVKGIQWIPNGDTTKGGYYMDKVGTALINIKGEKGSATTTYSSATALSALTKDSEYLSPLTGELYTAVSATFGGTYLSWVLYLSDALQWGLESLASEFQQIECRGCKGCDPNKCRKGSHGEMGSAQCNCSSIVSCTGVLPVLYRHGFSYGNPFNLEGYQQKGEDKDSLGDYSIVDEKEGSTKKCHEFLSSLSAVIDKNKQKDTKEHPLTNLLSQVGKLQYDIRLPWIFVLTVAWLVAVLYLAFGAIWPLDWAHMRSHWLRGGAHQWQCMWYKVMTGRKGMELVEYFGRK